MARQQERAVTRKAVVPPTYLDPRVWWLVLDRIESPGEAHDKVMLVAEHIHTKKRRVLAVI